MTRLTEIFSIYIVRAGASRFFDYRIASSVQNLNDLEKHRDETIEKLKVATKYNSTQQLLEKYGGESPKPSPKADEKQRKLEPKSNPSTPQQPVPRTGLAPPPTANIRREPFPDSPPTPVPLSAPSSPQNLPSPPYGIQNPPSNFQQPQTTQRPVNEPGFAPNAFPASSQYIEQSHWYDRLLDVLLGEDEMQTKNRLALICSTCRLVNGQAPPGIKTPEELGRWRCGACGTWNGEESEASKVLAGIRDQSQSQPRTVSVNGDGPWESVSKPDADTQSSGDHTDEAVMVAANEDGSVDGDAPEEPVKQEEPASNKAGRSKGGKRKG